MYIKRMLRCTSKQWLDVYQKQIQIHLKFRTSLAKQQIIFK